MRGYSLVVMRYDRDLEVQIAAYPYVFAELLWNSARLTLRDGAGPFRSSGRVSVRPRAFQFVPLVMAWRVNPIRLLIADDVGVGKTIEALLIGLELLDRGEIRRLCVLCPPYLCDQWCQELDEKFHIQAQVVRSGTVNQLERDLPLAARIQGSDQDTKLLHCARILESLINQGKRPIAWCRYIASRDYVAEEMAKRLEQREGRLDRLGQTDKSVPAILLYGRNNPVDGAVLDVLLRKAHEILNSLGVWFLCLSLLMLFQDALVGQVHGAWERARNREKENRTRFAQRASKPDEVERELKETAEEVKLS